MSLWEIYKAKKLGYADDLWTSLIGKKLGGYSWQSDYETTPYLYRAMPNLSHYYNREIMEEVVGGSVAWNQLCNGSSVTVQSGHKYFLKKGSAESVATSAGSAITGLTSGSDIVVDLTLALGSTIADYVYSLEQATAGSGVAWLKEHFPKMFGQYNPYDSGSIQSVSGLVSHDTVGKNLFDGVWESGAINDSGENISSPISIRAKNAVPTFGADRVCFSWGGGQSLYILIYAYKADGAFSRYISALTVSGTSVALNDDERYIKFYCYNNTTEPTNFQIEAGSSATAYEPYRKSSYPLDSTLTLRGIPKLDASNNLYYDGDVYESDGTVTRKYGVVDMGTLTWTDQSERGNYSYYSNVLSDGKKPADNTDVPNCKCAKYVTTDSYGFVANKPDKSITISTSGRINVKDNSYTTVEAFKSAMNGVYLVYELATPTTETAQPFTKTQLCDSGGTEEFVTSGIVSVGHKSKYAEK